MFEKFRLEQPLSQSNDAGKLSLVYYDDARSSAAISLFEPLPQYWDALPVDCKSASEAHLACLQRYRLSFTGLLHLHHRHQNPTY